MEMARNTNKRVSIENVCCAYPHLSKPWSFNGEGKGKYSLQVIMPKTHPQLEALKQAVLDAARARFGFDSDELPEDIRNPIMDGSEKEDDRPEYSGCVYFNARSNRAPAVNGGNKIYAGTSVNVLLSPYAYEYGGNRGVALGLNSVSAFEGSAKVVKGGDEFSKNCENTSQDDVVLEVTGESSYEDMPF